MPGPNLPQQTAVKPKPLQMPAQAPDAPLNAFTNTIPQPMQPTPLQAPTLPASPTAPPFNWQAPTIGPAPTATPYGDFHAPDPTQMAADPYYQFRLDQANKGAQRSAASHGTLLSGGFQQALAKLNQGLASEEGDKIYGRALQTYGTNRDTNQQNYGQSLAGYQAGTGAALDAGRLGLSGETAGYDRRYGALRDTYNDARDAATTQTNVANANTQSLDAFRQAVENARAASANQQPMAPPTPLGFAPRAPLPGHNTLMRRPYAGR